MLENYILSLVPDVSKHCICFTQKSYLEDGEIEVDMAWEAFTFLVLQICT